MSATSDFPAHGAVVTCNDDSVVFEPRGTTYQLLLLTRSRYVGPVNRPVKGLIHVPSRKIYTVASGGNFITPIVGPPRMVQGRIQYLDERSMVVDVGTAVIADLPSNDSAYDLPCGPLAVARLVNISLLPGATFEPLTSA